MFSALLAIPWFFLVYQLGDRHDFHIKLAEAGLLFLGTGIYLYLLFMLRKLLQWKFRFNAADRPVALLMKGNIVISAIGLLGLFSPMLESSVAIVTVILAIPLGVVQIIFGRTLLTLPHELNGLRNPYCYLNMATGLCQALVFLMPLALFTGAVADVMLGTIFLQAAARFENRG